MSKSITMSFSIPLELSIQIEEQIENEKISRSKLIKKALEIYLEQKKIDKESSKLINEIFKIVVETRDLLKK
jgi:metal-responsive CopG/Arc/MetJ family transcriptional regulator